MVKNKEEVCKFEDRTRNQYPSIRLRIYLAVLVDRRTLAFLFALFQNQFLQIVNSEGWSTYASNKWCKSVYMRIFFNGRRFELIPTEQFRGMLRVSDITSIRITLITFSTNFELMALRHDQDFLTVDFEVSLVKIHRRLRWYNRAELFTASSPLDLSDGHWHTVSVRFRKEGGIALAVDGVDVSVNRHPITTTHVLSWPTSNGLSIGGYAVGSNHFRGCFKNFYVDYSDILQFYSDIFHERWTNSCEHLFEKKRMQVSVTFRQNGSAEYVYGEEAVPGPDRPPVRIAFRWRTENPRATVLQHRTEMSNGNTIETTVRLDGGVLTLTHCAPGKQLAYLKSNAQLATGQWNDIQVDIGRTVLRLRVNADSVEKQVNNVEQFWKTASKMMSRIRFGRPVGCVCLDECAAVDGFTGCLEGVQIQNYTVDVYTAPVRNNLAVGCYECLFEASRNVCMALDNSKGTFLPEEEEEEEEREKQKVEENETMQSTIYAGEISVEVDEGAEVYLEPETLQLLIRALDTRKNLLFTVHQSPTYGKLYKLYENFRIAVEQFTDADVALQRILYLHDGSETSIDFCILEVESLENYRGFTNTPPLLMVNFQIRPINDSPKVFLPTNGLLQMMQQSCLQLTDHYFFVEDADDPLEQVHIVVREQTPSLSYMQLADQTDHPVERFTGQNLRDGLVSVVHVAGQRSDITLRVADSHNSAMTVQFRVQANHVRIRSKSKKPLTVFHGSSAVLNADHLSFVIAAGDDELTAVMYEVLEPALYGLLELELTERMWVVVDRFNQSNVDESRVRYKHANGGFPTSDQIRLKISGQNPDIASETLLEVKFARKAIKVFSATPFVTFSQRKSTIQRNHLLAWTFPKPTNPDDIRYEITKASVYGFLVKVFEQSDGGKVRRLGVYSNFSQTDIDNGRLHYQLRYNHFSLLHDYFQFTVTALGITTTPSRFSIVYIPENERGMLVNRTLIIKRGMTKVISNSTIYASMNRFYNFLYKVVSGPKFGRLFLTSSSSSSSSAAVASSAPVAFTNADINGGQLFYEHDGSESTRDQVFLLVSPLLENNVVEDRIKLTIWFRIRILPNSPLPPKRTDDRILYVPINGEKLIDVDDIGFENTAPSTLLEYHFADSHPSGHFFLTSLPNATANTFSQQQLKNGKVGFRHTGQQSNKMIEIPFYVTDGKHIVHDRLVVQASELFFMLRPVRPLEARFGELVELGVDLFERKSSLNITKKQITLLIAEPLNNGRLLKQSNQMTKTVNRFTYEDIVQGRIFYVHSETSEHSIVNRIRFAVRAGSFQTQFHLQINIIRQSPDYRMNIEVVRGGVATLTVDHLDADHSIWTSVSARTVLLAVIVPPIHGSLALGRYVGSRSSTMLDLINVDRYHCNQATLHDVQNHLLHYVHHHDPNVNKTVHSHHNDSVLFSVTSSTLPGRRLRILVNVTFQEAIDIRDGQLTVAEFSRVLVSSQTIRLSTNMVIAESSERLLLTNGPKHGLLVVDEPGKRPSIVSSTVEWDKVRFGRLWYVHDSGDHHQFEDQFQVMATVDNGTCQSAPATVYLRILRANLQPPKILLNEPMRWKSKRQNWAILSNQHLKVADEDSPIDQLKILVTSSQSCYLAFAGHLSDAVHEFTQTDVDEGRVILVKNDDKFPTDDDDENGLFGFTFFVTDGKWNSMPDWFRVVSFDRLSAVHENHRLDVAPGSLSQITNHHLPLLSDDKSSFDYVYSVLDPPAYGELLLENGLTSVFTRSDVENGLLAYNQTVPIRSWSGRDSFTYVLSRTNSFPNYGNVSALFERCRFRIRISHAFLAAATLDSLVPTRPLLVQYGGVCELGSANLDTSTLERQCGCSIKIDWLQLPRHGWLEVRGENVTKSGMLPVSSAELQLGLVFYHHSSFSWSDRVVVGIRPKHWSKQSQQDTLVVRLKCIVKGAFDAVPNYENVRNLGTVRLVRGCSRTLTEKDFSAQMEKDSRTRYKVIKHSTNARLICSGVLASRFSWADLQNGSLSLHSTGSLDNDSVLIVAMEEQQLKQMESSIVYRLEVQIEPLTLELAHANVVYYSQTELLVPVNNRSLLAQSNGPPDGIVYEIQMAPQNGSLKWSNGSLCTRFTQRNVDDGLVLYHPTNRDAYRDQLLFKVSDSYNTLDRQVLSFWALPALDQKDVVVTAGQRALITAEHLALHPMLQGKAVAFRVLSRPVYGKLVNAGNAVSDYFDAIDLLERRLEYVSDRPVDRDVLLDHFTFELRAEHLPPARGQVSIVVVHTPSDARLQLSSAVDDSIATEEFTLSPFVDVGSALWVPNIDPKHDLVGFVLLIVSVASVFVVLIRKIRVYGKKRRFLINTEYQMTMVPLDDEIVEPAATSLLAETPLSSDQTLDARQLETSPINNRTSSSSACGPMKHKISLDLCASSDTTLAEHGHQNYIPAVTNSEPSGSVELAVKLNKNQYWLLSRKHVVVHALDDTNRKVFPLHLVIDCISPLSQWTDDLKSMVRLYSRINGWSAPPHPLQILAWFIVAFVSFMIFGVLIPSFQSYKARLSLYIIFSMSITLTIVMKIIVTSLDPSDDLVSKKIRHQPRPRFDRERCKHVIDEHYFCNVCEMFIHPSSKHCRQCNKCVYNFDHHCKWLNNCIGGKNYKCFIAFICTVSFLTICIFALATVIIILFFTVPKFLSLTDGRFILCGKAISESTWLTLTASIVLISFTIAVLSLHLLFFHIKLMNQGLTTYSYVVAQRRNEEASDHDNHITPIVECCFLLKRRWNMDNCLPGHSSKKQKVTKVCPILPVQKSVSQNG
ncbi:Chondroitin sulfate proteoglycan 4 [Trichinella pseudospiralis]|uniref:Chondroitin sulfate proteoglycan 4 n=1 Tax=Trichinella pseudospiralis TaxID=6337 RepID=A0A0V1FAS7_TRIPS|nr:Chondroitin sulfate proteoglycan 4 [Trichinella pseudospiralis]